MKLPKNKVIKFKVDVSEDNNLYRGFYDKDYKKFVVTWVNILKENKCIHYEKKTAIEYFEEGSWIEVI